MKLLILGGNGFHDRAAVHAALDRVDKKRPILLAVFDDVSQGAQLLALEWVKAHPGMGWTMCPVGEAWGLIEPDGAVAFPDDDMPDSVVDTWAGKAKVWRPILDAERV